MPSPMIMLSEVNPTEFKATYSLVSMFRVAVIDGLYQYMSALDCILIVMISNIHKK